MARRREEAWHHAAPSPPFPRLLCASGSVTRQRGGLHVLGWGSGRKRSCLLRLHGKPTPWLRGQSFPAPSASSSWGGCAGPSEVGGGPVCQAFPPLVSYHVIRNWRCLPACRDKEKGHVPRVSHFRALCSELYTDY